MAAPSLDVIPVVAAPFRNVILWKAEAGGYPQLHSEFEGHYLNTLPNPKKEKKVIEVPPNTHTPVAIGSGCISPGSVGWVRLWILALWRLKGSLAWRGGAGASPLGLS